MNNAALEILERLKRIEQALAKLQDTVEGKGGSPMAIDIGKGG